MIAISIFWVVVLASIVYGIEFLSSDKSKGFLHEVQVISLTALVPFLLAFLVIIIFY